MLNHATLMGRLTANPELRHTSSDIPLCKFSIAVDRDYSAGGSDKQTDFIDIIAWRHTAEFVSQYFKKGNAIVVDGRIQTGSFEKDGIKRKTFEIVANNVYFGESKKSSSNSAEYDSETSVDKDVSSYSNDVSFDSDDDDDDLPF